MNLLLNCSITTRRRFYLNITCSSGEIGDLYVLIMSILLGNELRYNNFHFANVLCLLFLLVPGLLGHADEGGLLAQHLVGYGLGHDFVREVELPRKEDIVLHAGCGLVQLLLEALYDLEYPHLVDVWILQARLCVNFDRLLQVSVDFAVEPGQFHLSFEFLYTSARLEEHLEL